MITQVISQFPPAPSSTTDTPVEFNAKADSFVHHQADTYVTEVNTFSTQANGLKDEMNQVKTDIDEIAGSIPSGTIDDTNIGADKVFSNQKTEATFAKIDDSFGIESGIGYTKFPDGTMICSGTVTTAVGKNSTYASTDVTFPQEFISTPAVTYGAGAYSDASMIVTYSDAITTTKVTSIQLARNQQLSPSNVAGIAWCGYMAIGRWK